MARKKGRPNLSAAVRNYLTENPGAAVKDVIATLGEGGMKINPSLVYFVKGKMKGTKQRAIAHQPGMGRVIDVGAGKPVAGGLVGSGGVASALAGVDRSCPGGDDPGRAFGRVRAGCAIC